MIIVALLALAMAIGAIFLPGYGVYVAMLSSLAAFISFPRHFMLGTITLLTNIINSLFSPLVVMQASLLAADYGLDPDSGARLFFWIIVAPQIALFIVAYVYTLWRTGYWKTLFHRYLMERLMGKGSGASNEDPPARDSRAQE